MIEIKSIQYHYPNSKKLIIDDFSFSLNESEIVSFIGPSGCGKTTLLKIIGGHLTPQEGKIIIDKNLNPRPSRNRIIINQEDDLFNWMDVKNNILFAMKDKNQKKYEKIIAMLKIYEFQHKYPYQLSGGMKKRVSIARSIAADSKYILMDEPFNSLDYVLKTNIYNDLKKIWSTTRKTIILVTHDIEDAIQISNRIIILSNENMRIKSQIDIRKIENESHIDKKQIRKLKSMIINSLIN